MADELIDNIQTGGEQQASAEPTVEAQIKEQMEFRLNGIVPEAAAEQAVAQTEGTEQAVTQTEAPVFQFQTFTEKYGWQSPDDAVKEIEELRALKANPTAAEIKYENEQSEKLAKALQAGKIDEVYGYLDEQRRLDRLTASEVTKETANDIIKLSMQLKYKDEGLTAEDVEYKFGKMYKLPKEPPLDPDDDESVEKHKEWQETVSDIEAGKIIDAKIAKRELEAAKSKLVLPNIEAEIDQDYIQYKKDLEQSSAIDAETKEAYKSFTPKDIETRISFNDEANKIAFEFHYEPEAEGFAKSLDLVTDTQKYFEKYKNSDGSPNRKQFLQDIYFIQNKEKIIMAAMNQAKNATLKAQLPDNSQGSFQRQQPQTGEPNELHKYMQAAGVV